MSGRVGGEDESVGIVVWGFAVEVEDTPVAVSKNHQHSTMTSEGSRLRSRAHQDTYQLHLPFPRAWVVIPPPCREGLISRRPQSTPTFRAEQYPPSWRPGLAVLFISSCLGLDVEKSDVGVVLLCSSGGERFTGEEEVKYILG